MNNGVFSRSKNKNSDPSQLIYDTAGDGGTGELGYLVEFWQRSEITQSSDNFIFIRLRGHRSSSFKRQAYALPKVRNPLLDCVCPGNEICQCANMARHRSEALCEVLVWILINKIKIKYI